MNTIYNLRAIEFLAESGKIDNIPIDYTSSEYQKVGQGYFGAFVDSQSDARKKEPLNLRKIVHWQEMIADEDLVKVKEKETKSTENEEDFSSLSSLITQINQSLIQAKWYDDVEFCKIVGNSLQQLTQLHPFPEKDNGRIARLIANYIATYCGKPLIVFKSTTGEKEAYQIAVASPEKMWIFIAQKIQEAVFSLDGTLMVPIPSKSEEDKERMGILYQSISSDEKLLVQWHKLKSAVEKWKSIE
jgi:hypothetical protein